MISPPAVLSVIALCLECGRRVLLFTRTDGMLPRSPPSRKTTASTGRRRRTPWLARRRRMTGRMAVARLCSWRILCRSAVRPMVLIAPNAMQSRYCVVPNLPVHQCAPLHECKIPVPHAQTGTHARPYTGMHPRSHAYCCAVVVGRGLLLLCLPPGT